jgi:hypothetical protein
VRKHRRASPAWSSSLPGDVLLVRLLGLLAAIGLAVSILLYMVTGERKYLRFAWRLFKYALFLILVILLMLLFERLLVAL